MCTHLIPQKYKMQLIFQTNNPIHNCSPSPHQILLLKISLTCSFNSTSNGFLPYTHTHTNLCHITFFSYPLCVCTRIISTWPLSPLLCIIMLTLPSRHLQLLLCLHINKSQRNTLNGASHPNSLLDLQKVCVMQVFFCTCSCCFFLLGLDLHFYLFICEFNFESSKMIWKHIQKKLYT
jgi:hypothetical protein